MRQISNRVVRKLTAADGYLDLGLPGHALAELASIGEAGPLQPAVEFMTGESLKSQSRFDEAIEPLQRAAVNIPAPHNRGAWRSLGECFRHNGQTELAEIADMFADDTGIPEGWDDGWTDAALDEAEADAHAAALEAEMTAHTAWRFSIDPAGEAGRN